MIQVCEGNEAEAVLLRKLLKQEHQGDGVRSTGEADQQSGAARTEPVSADRAANLLDGDEPTQLPTPPTPKRPSSTRRLRELARHHLAWELLLASRSSPEQAERRLVPEGGLEPPTPRL